MIDMKIKIPYILTKGLTINQIKKSMKEKKIIL